MGGTCISAILPQNNYPSQYLHVSFNDQEVTTMAGKKKKEEPIYEKLAPGEVLIISKDESGCLKVAENNKGKVTIRKVCVQES